MFLGLLGVHFTSSGVTPSGILANSVYHPSVPTLRYYVTAHRHGGGGGLQVLILLVAILLFTPPASFSV